MYRRIGKRIFDIILAVTGLIALLPLFVLLTVVLCIHHRGKPFFFQLRPGRNGRLFTIFKFRTISEGECYREKSPSQRISLLGRILRKTSLDEIPQLWNVLRGDMSMVGPRPLLEAYLPLYSQEQFGRHAVLPGITGLAQVKGRNDLAWAQKIRYDLLYVKHQSFGLDIRILLLTLQTVIMQNGANASDTHLPEQPNT